MARIRSRTRRHMWVAFVVVSLLLHSLERIGISRVLYANEYDNMLIRKNNRELRAMKETVLKILIYVHTST